jgi:translation initiation factor IF-3
MVVPSSLWLRTFDRLLLSNAIIRRSVASTITRQDTPLVTTCRSLQFREDWYLRSLSTQSIIPKGPTDNNKKQHGKKAAPNPLYTNERLVAAIRKDKRGIPADKIMVRLVQILDSPKPRRNKHVKNDSDDDDDDDDDGSNDDDDSESTSGNESNDDKESTSSEDKTVKREIKLITLAEAIQISIEARQDLVEVSRGHEIPVVKLADLKADLYKLGKKRAIKPMGEQQFRINVGSAENDLKRKVDALKVALEKGHSCSVQFRSRQRNINQNVDIVLQTVQKVIDLVAFVGDPVKKAEVNEENSMAQLLLRPKSLSSKKEHKKSDS